jgi:hypothetical protein
VLSKTQVVEDVLFIHGHPVKGNEPFVRFVNPVITIQFQSGMSTHQFVFRTPTTAFGLSSGDSLLFKIARQRTIKTWFGRLLEKLRA